MHEKIDNTTTILTIEKTNTENNIKDTRNILHEIETEKYMKNIMTKKEPKKGYKLTKQNNRKIPKTLLP